MCGAFAYNGFRVMCASRLHRPMFRRMLLLMIVCGLALVSKGLTFIIVASGGWYTNMIFKSLSNRCVREICHFEPFTSWVEAQVGTGSSP